MNKQAEATRILASSVEAHQPRTYRCTQGHEWTTNDYTLPRSPEIDIGGPWCYLCLQEKLVPLLAALGVGRVGRVDLCR